MPDKDCARRKPGPDTRNSKRKLVMPLVVAVCLSVYYYTVSSPLRFLFMEGGAEAVIWELRSPFERGVLLFFLFSLAFAFAGRVMLRKKKMPEGPMLFLCLPGLMVFSYLPAAARFPEFIPAAAVLLPAAALAGFISSFFAPDFKKNPPPRRSFTGMDRRAGAVFIVSLLVFFASGYHINETTGYHSGDEGHYLTMAKSMAEDFDLDIRNQIPGYTPEMRARVHISPHSTKGYGYSWHPPGLSVAFAPFFRIHENHRSGKRGALFALYIMGAFLAGQVYLAARDASGSKNTGVFVSAVMMLSSPMWIYSIRAYPMMPGALTILYCWRHLGKIEVLSAHRFALFNLLLAWMVWLHDTFIPAYGILVFVLFICWMKRFKNKKLFAVFFLQAFNVLTFVVFRFRWFGADFFGQHGGLFNFWPGIFATWFDFFRGMIFHSPVHFLAFVLLCAYAVRRRDPQSLLLLLLYLSVYIPSTSAATHWTGGASHPGRRLAPCIPLAGAALAYFTAKIRKLSFRWLVIFSGAVSAGFMAYFILFNPYGFTRPLSALVTYLGIFRPLDFHLPDFGKSFAGFPWNHFYFTAVNTLLFVFFWVFLVKSEKTPRLRYVSAAAAATLLWVFVSIGMMKTYFNTTPPVEKTTRMNLTGNTLKLAQIIPGDRLFLYSVRGGEDGFSLAIPVDGLPRHLELSRGVYELKISGSAPPGARAQASIVYTRRGIAFGGFAVYADENGRFDAVKYIRMPDNSAHISIFFDGPENFNVEQTLITPAPRWLEMLSERARTAGSGFFSYIHREPADEYAAIAPDKFELSSDSFPGHLPNILDGDPSSRWTPHAPQSPGMYFKVDMGETRRVSGVVLSHGRFVDDWPRSADVYASADGETWELVHRGDGLGGRVYRDKNDPCLLSSDNCTRIIFRPVEARWLRIEQSSSDDFLWWSVSGFSILSGGGTDAVP